MQNTRREDLLGLTTAELRSRGFRLCSDHFEDSQFNCPAERRSLVWNAVPTLFSVPNPPEPVTPKRQPPRKRVLAPEELSSKRRRTEQLQGMNYMETVVNKTSVSCHDAI